MPHHKLRLLVRFPRAVQEQVALRATPPQLGDDIAARNQCESVREHFVVTLERGFGVALLELDVAQVLEAEELGAGFGYLISQPRALVNTLDRLSDPTGVQVHDGFEQVCVAQMCFVPAVLFTHERGATGRYGGRLPKAARSRLTTAPGVAAPMTKALSRS